MAKTTDKIRRMSQEDWLAEGKRLFGDDPTLWRFVCPNCGHVQTIADFIELKLADLAFEEDTERAYYSCIGRHDPRIPRNKIGELGAGKEYCNYTLGGCIHLHKTVVINEDGEENLVFEFAEPEGGEQSEIQATGSA